MISRKFRVTFANSAGLEGEPLNSKVRHQGFHPFAFGPQRFGPDPLMAGLPFKLP
ncbi:hypothetical protein ACLKA7_000677, partial [Drosophila subpalustris]